MRHVAAIEIFGGPAREDHDVDFAGVSQRVSDHQRTCEARQFRTCSHLEQRVDQGGGEIEPGFFRNRRADFQLDTAVSRNNVRRGFASGQLLLLVKDNKPRADIDRGCFDHAPASRNGEFAGAAADVDAEHRRRRSALRRSGDRPGTISGHLGLEQRSGAGADELSGLLGEQANDCLGVVLAGGIARGDDRAGVDVRLTKVSLRVGVLDERRQTRHVERFARPKRRQDDRRGIIDAAVDQFETAGKHGALPPHFQRGKNQVRGGGADVDADAAQHDTVAAPQRMGPLQGRGVAFGMDMILADFMHGPMSPASGGLFAPFGERPRLGTVLLQALEKKVEHVGVFRPVSYLIAGVLMQVFRSEILEHHAPIPVVHGEIARRRGAGIEMLMKPHVRRHEE